MQPLWLFSRSDLASTPSVASGVFDGREERLHRAKAVRFVTDVGYELQLRQSTIATASCLTHRFFMRRSMRDCPPIEAAAAALFLACKVDEAVRRSALDFVSAVARIASKNTSLTLTQHSKEFKRWIESIIKLEEIMMGLLCFDLRIDLPYRFLQEHVSKMVERNIIPVAMMPDLERLSWVWINDSLKTMACLQFHPATIAAATVIMAAKEILDLPSSDESLESIQKWCEILAEKYSDIQSIMDDINELYTFVGFRFCLEGKYESHLVRERRKKKRSTSERSRDPKKRAKLNASIGKEAVPMDVEMDVVLPTSSQQSSVDLDSEMVRSSQELSTELSTEKDETVVMVDSSVAENIVEEGNEDESSCKVDSKDVMKEDNVMKEDGDAPLNVEEKIQDDSKDQNDVLMITNEMEEPQAEKEKTKGSEKDSKGKTRESAAVKYQKKRSCDEKAAIESEKSHEKVNDEKTKESQEMPSKTDQLEPATSSLDHLQGGPESGPEFDF